MTNVKPLWQVALKGYGAWIIICHLGLLALMLFTSFIRWDLEGFTKFDWTDVRVCLVVALALNVFWLQDGSSKHGGKREWDQATADKWDRSDE